MPNTKKKKMPTLDWIGKKAVLNHHNEIPFRLLKTEFIEGEENSGNLIVHGDNLHALKALLPYYAGQVKCIYIDPPYNTGNEEWEYNDNVNSPEMKAWLNKTVKEDDLSRHDKWLCMMYPRLKLLHKLLADDGVIFISIDDNEQSNLKLMIDEIFGGGNFIATLPTIMNLKGNQDQFGFAGTHEYTLVYCKNKTITKIYQFEIDEEALEDWEEDDLGLFKKGANLKSTGGNAPRTKRPYLYYPILVNRTTKDVVSIQKTEYELIYNKLDKSFNDEHINDLISKYEKKGYSVLLPITNNEKMSWRWGFEKSKNDNYDIIVNGENTTFSIYKKQRPDIGDLPSKKAKTLFYKPVYSSGNGTTQLKNIFSKKLFPNPKPIELIIDFLKLSTDKNALILDSFAGSGTTAHAVMNLNKQDSGNRKYILVEMEDYAETTTAERVKRVINGYDIKKSNGNEEKVEGLGGGFRYCVLDEPLFNEFGDINPKVKYKELASHIFFSETGVPMSEVQVENFPQIGIYKSTAYYLLYNGILGDKSVNGGNIITRKTLEAIKVIDFEGLKVVFAEGTRINPLKLKKEFNIEFKQTHYEIKIS